MARSAAGLSTQAAGPALPRPVALCALLAFAAHAALLGLHLPSGGASASAGALPRPIQVSLVTAATPAPEPVFPDTPAALALPPADEPIEQSGTIAPATDVADSTVPRFIQEPSPLDFPDAVIPEAGVQLRIHVRLDGEGQVQHLVSALLPADAPDAFRHIGEKALGDALFPPGEAHRAHCLQLDFKPDQRTPTWSWRTDGPTRCLTNPADSAQALPAR